jgi:hypothetical protein
MRLFTHWPQHHDVCLCCIHTSLCHDAAGHVSVLRLCSCHIWGITADSDVDNHNLLYCLWAKFLLSLQCLGLMTVTSMWLTQMHESKTYLNSISCLNKWSHCFLCVYYCGLMISKFLYPFSPVLCCLPDICFNSLLKCKVFLNSLSLLYELWSHPCGESTWQVFFHNHIYLLPHLDVACTLQQIPQTFALCCCNCSDVNIQFFVF